MHVESVAFDTLGQRLVMLDPHGGSSADASQPVDTDKPVDDG
jgi:hypothetical protein